MQSADAGWARRYDKLAAASAEAIAALPDGGAVVFAHGFQRTLFTIDGAGDVTAARQFEAQPSFIASGPGGEIFVGSWISAVPGSLGSTWVSRLDNTLSPKWTRRLEMPYGNLRINGAAAMRDGGVVLGGQYGDASFALKLDAAGALAWSTLLDPSDRDHFNDVFATRDGGTICAGESRRGPWLVKLDRTGKVVWHRTFPQEGTFRSVVESREGHLVAAGRLYGSAFVAAMDGDGKPRWQKVIEGLKVAEGVRELARGDFVIAAATETNDSVLLEIDGAGSLGWRKRLDRTKVRTTGVLHAASLATTADAIYFAPATLGGLEGAVNVFKLDASGGIACPWFVDMPSISIADMTLASEQLSLDIREFEVSVASASPSTSGVSIAGAALPCSAAQEARKQTAVAPATPASAGMTDEEKRQTGYRDLLVAKKYDELETVIEGLRREHGRYDPMWWEIGYFYDVLARDNSVPEEERLARLRAWTEARPQSSAARIALAKALTVSAWRHRGSGYSDTVTEKGWAEYRRALDEAKRVLGTVSQSAEDDSQYWLLLVDFAHLVDDVDVRDVVRRAAAKGHHNPELYRTAAGYLYPKWGGSGELYRAFAEESATLTRSTFGEGMYAWLAYQAMFNTTEEEYARDFAFDWERMKRGFEDIIRLDPNSQRSAHRYAWVASRFDDRKTARSLFQRPELAWYAGAERIWRPRTMYDTYREWALRTPFEPFVESTSPVIASSSKAVSVRARAADTRKWPSIVMQGELAVGSAVHRNAAFFVRPDKNAAIVVSAVPRNPDRKDQDNAIRDIERMMSKWTIWAPSKPGEVRQVTAFATVDPPNPQHALALTLAPAKGNPPVHVLTAAPSDRNTSNTRRLYVVGCRWVGSKCEQVVAEGSHVGEMSDGSYRHVQIGLYDRFDRDAFVGGPVLNEDGYVVAVATGDGGAKAGDYAQVIEADYLPSVSAPAPKVATAAAPGKPVRMRGITMQSDLTLGSNRFARLGSFLVNTPSGVVAVSMIPGSSETDKQNLVRDAWATFTKGTMWGPEQPKRILTINALRTPEPAPWQHGVAFGFASARGDLPVHVLEPVPADRESFSGSCFVVGCVWTEGRCTETVVKAEIQSASRSKARVVQQLTLSFNEALPKDAFVGAAVLNDEGYVLGVLTDRSNSQSPQYPHRRDADGIGIVVQR